MSAPRCAHLKPSSTLARFPAFALLLLACLATGCTLAHDSTPSAGAAREVLPSIAPAADLTRGPLALTGDPAAAAAGLEVVTWLSAADPSTIARAVDPLPQTHTHLSAHTRDLWRACGFRIISVDLADLDQLHAALAAAPSVERAWLGQALTWTEAVRGPELPRGLAVATDADRLDLPRGRLRLLARSWIAPVPPDSAPLSPAGNLPTPTGTIRRELTSATDGSTASEVPPPRRADSAVALPPPAAAARVHVELLPQHLPSSSRASRERAALTLETPHGLTPPDRQGLLFRRLLLSALLPPGRVLVIIPEDPAADWPALAARALQDPAESGLTPSTDSQRGGPPAPADTAVGRVSRANDSSAPPVDDRDRGDWASVLAAPARPLRPAAGHPESSSPATLAQRIARKIPEGSSAAIADTAAEHSSDLTAGPPSPRIPTIGEAMLITRPPPPNRKIPGAAAPAAPSAPPTTASPAPSSC